VPLALAAATAVFLAAAGGAGVACAATARVQYVSAASVYLDTGRASGLIEGAGVTVTRDGKVIARLTVMFAADHSAACRIDALSQAVRAGDVASFTAAAVADSSAAGDGSSPSDSSGTAAGARAPDGPAASGAGASGSLWPSSGHMHGRVTSLYTKTSDPSGTYENPSLFGDLRWTGKGVGQTTLRARATRPVIRALTDLPGTQIEESRVRVYEAAAGYRSPAGRLEVEAGRVLPQRLEGIGYLDGAAVHWRPGPAVSLGAVGGRGADLSTAGFRSGGLELGGYVEVGSPATGFRPRRWHAMVGAAFSGDSVLTRRQCVLERADFVSGADATLYQSAELDLNPRWKRDHGEPALGWTAWSVGSTFWTRRRVSFSVSADSRRAVLLPEQIATTAPIILDRFTGAHVSSRVTLPRDCALRLGGDVRRRDRDGEILSSWDAGLTGSRIGRKELSGGLHAMGYSGDHFSGVNGEANLTARISASSQIDVAGGLGGTSTDLVGTPAPSYRSRWLRAGIDYRTPGGLGAALAHEWRSGGPGNELTAELGLSF
jgi:hypothetical protein